MKYINKYKLVSESLSLRDLDDDELRAKLNWLNIDKNETYSKIEIQTRTSIYFVIS